MSFAGISVIVMVDKMIGWAVCGGISSSAAAACWDGGS